MNVFIQLAEFIYNNLMTISFFLALFVFFVFHVKQLVQAAMINQKLNVKKKFMRSLEGMNFRKLFTKRVAVLVLPLLILGGIFLFYPRDSVTFDDYLNKITSKEDVVARYENFNQRFYSHHFQDVPERQDDVDILKSLRSKTPSLHENVDTVAYHEDYIFSIDETNVHITYKQHEGNLTHVDSLSFEEETSPIEIFHPYGLYVDYNKLVVIGQVKENIPDGSRDSAYLEENFRTVVKVFDVGDGFEPLDTYRMDGVLTDVSFNGTNLMMSTTRYLPFDYESFDLDDYRPWSQMNDEDRYYNRYTSMRYVERVKPNSLVSFHTLNVRTDNHDFETLLTDYRHKVAMKDNDIYSIANSYTFYEISDGVSLPNPVRSTDTTITQLNVIGNRLYRHRARRLEGTVNLDVGVSIAQRDFVILTLSDGHQIINKLDRKMMQPVQSKTVEKEGSFRHMYYHNGLVYLSRFVENSPYMNVYDVRDDDGIVHKTTHESSPLTSCTVPVGDRGFLSFNRGPSTLHAISYISSEDNDIDFVHMRVIAPLDYHFRLEERPIDCRNVHYDSENRIFSFPIYVSARRQYNFEELPAVLMFNVSEGGSLSSPDVLHMPLSFISDNPFGYRTHTDGDYRYHITPNGIVSTERTDVSETIDEVLFP